MIPTRLELHDIQASFKDIQSKLDTLLVRNVDMSGRRVINAGKSVSPFDYVTRLEMDDVASSLNEALSAETQRVTGLLRGTGNVRYGVFSTRGAPEAFTGQCFVATDLDYIGWLSTGSAWIYVFGTRAVTQANIAAFTANLGTTDVGCLINVTDYTHLLKWTGSALTFAPGDDGSGYIQGFPLTPTGGTWGICDGTAYNYLKGDGTTASFTTPNYATAAYLKFGTTDAIGPTAAGGVVSAESSHTHAVDPPSTASGAPSGTTTVDNNLDGTTIAVGSATHTHATDIASFSSGAGSAHDHGPNTLELRRTQLAAYFRR